jgi:hypothetical protein
MYALFLFVVSARAATLFVASDGSDGGAGTRDAPFASLARALAAARALQPLAADVDILVRAGAYAQSETLALSPADSGAGADARLRLVGGWPGDAPAPAVVHAGAAVSGWAQTTDAAVWTAPLPAGVVDTRQLWRDGARVPQAAAGGLSAAVLTDTGYECDAAPWLAETPVQAARDFEFLYTGVGSSWTESRMRVAALAPLPGGRVNVTMAQPAWSFHKRAYGQALTTPASSTNVAAALLTGSGTWTVNSVTRTLFYAPRAGEDPRAAAFIVPSLDVLVNVTGASWVTFQNLTFSFATWQAPSQGEGYVDMQSGYHLSDPRSAADPDQDDWWVPVPGNVQLHGSSHVDFVGCVFEHLGATALAVHDSCHSVAVANNTFADVSCAGVAMGQVSDVNVTAADANSHFTVDGNLFDNIPVEFRDCPAILGGYALDANVTHNAILNASNGGICWGWGWSRDEATNSGFTTIAQNYVYRSNWLLEDCGSIYVLGPQPNSTMFENYASSQVKLFGALYTDEGSAYWHIWRNVVHNVPEWLHIVRSAAACGAQ